MHTYGVNAIANEWLKIEMKEKKALKAIAEWILLYISREKLYSHGLVFFPCCIVVFISLGRLFESIHTGHIL